MTNWDVFLILAEIIAFIAVILKFSSKFIQALAEFRVIIEQLKETVGEMKNSSRETHTEIFHKLDDHETRISHLEGDKKNKN